jgi:hypothetical protein
VLEGMYMTVQYSTVQYCTVHHRRVDDKTGQASRVQHSRVKVPQQRDEGLCVWVFSVKDNYSRTERVTSVSTFLHSHFYRHVEDFTLFYQVDYEGSAVFCVSL